MLETMPRPQLLLGTQTIPDILHGMLVCPGYVKLVTACLGDCVHKVVHNVELVIVTAAMKC